MPSSNAPQTPQLFTTIAELRAHLSACRRAQQSIALVPTMGNLHAGHLSLVQTARTHADCVVVSIFINPTQFDENEDFADYPRTPNADIAALLGLADVVFAPSTSEMYPTMPPPISLQLPALADDLCGKNRPTHFAGVGLIVSKLFNIVRPDIAVFGKKDYQQLAIIRALNQTLNFNIKIIGGEIVRASDGLALSSRNQYLSPQARAIAPILQQTLQQLAVDIRQAAFADHPQLMQTKLIQEKIDTLNNLGFAVDYLALRARNLITPMPDDKALVLLVAAKLGNTRLLDNLEFEI